MFFKGRGRSHMISDYLVQHPLGAFFSLSEKEYNQATICYPSLLSDLSDISYDGYSATVGISVGEQGYFDNQRILSQFEHLFQLLPLKKEYKDHEIEVATDNVRTHSAREYNVNDFGKGISTKCPVHALEYLDHQDSTVSVSCYFDKGEHRRKSKRLLELAKDLSVRSFINEAARISRTSSSPSGFPNISKLEKLAHKYNVRIIFVPKLHCELNAIQGLWCRKKQFVRKTTDQTFLTMMRLIPESRENFIHKKIQLKLFRHFWRSPNAYNQGTSYGKVLICLFLACYASMKSLHIEE